MPLPVVAPAAATAPLLVNVPHANPHESYTVAIVLPPPSHSTNGTTASPPPTTTSPVYAAASSQGNAVPLTTSPSVYSSGAAATGGANTSAALLDRERAHAEELTRQLSDERSAAAQLRMRLNAAEQV